jgi:hypothetical protein
MFNVNDRWKVKYCENNFSNFVKKKEEVKTWLKTSA